MRSAPNYTNTWFLALCAATALHLLLVFTPLRGLFSNIDGDSNILSLKISLPKSTIEEPVVYPTPADSRTAPPDEEPPKSFSAPSDRKNPHNSAPKNKNRQQQQFIQASWAKEREPIPSPEPLSEQNHSQDSSPTNDKRMDNQDLATPSGLSNTWTSTDSIPANGLHESQEIQLQAIDPARAMKAYGLEISRAISRQERYPMIARRMMLEGIAIVKVRIGRDGSLLDEPVLKRSSGAGALDQEAIRMAGAAAPFPPFPEELSTRSVEFPVPISFILE